MIKKNFGIILMVIGLCLILTGQIIRSCESKKKEPVVTKQVIRDTIITERKVETETTGKVVPAQIITPQVPQSTSGTNITINNYAR